MITEKQVKQIRKAIVIDKLASTNTVTKYMAKVYLKMPLVNGGEETMRLYAIFYVYEKDKKLRQVFKEQREKIIDKLFECHNNGMWQIIENKHVEYNGKNRIIKHVMNPIQVSWDKCVTITRSYYIDRSRPIKIVKMK